LIHFYKRSMDTAEEKPNHPIRLSLFPRWPPYIRMLPEDESYSPPLPKELVQFTFTAPNAISPIIVNTINKAGFTLNQDKVRSKENLPEGIIWDCLPITEKAKDEIHFKGLSYEVKINQFPGIFIIGRKDFLWTCYNSMREKFGEEHFNFLPHTYILPREKDELVSVMNSANKVWIMKPPNWFCGIGISLINSAKEIPQKRNLFCIQEYIDKPLLIRGLKFDLRLYVLLTNLDPIRVYIFEDGLVRFATKEYTNSPQELKNNFIHLTNFSVNKNNDDFVYNKNPGKYEGHKWNVKTLWKYFEEEMNIDWKPVWENVKDVCLKTIICGHEHMSKEYNRQIKSDYNCFKLFGFDVFLDETLKPWILEVNNIPSLHINDIDAFVNYPMISEMFNIVGMHLPREIGNKCQRVLEDKLSLKKSPLGSFSCNYKLYTRIRSEREKEKICKYVMSEEHKPNYRATILNDLTPSDIRTLVHTEEELSQTKDWTRLLPNDKDTDYLQFLSRFSYSDRLLDAWNVKYGGSHHKREEGLKILADLCSQGKHFSE